MFFIIYNYENKKISIINIIYCLEIQYYDFFFNIFMNSNVFLYKFNKFMYSYIGFLKLHTR